MWLIDLCFLMTHIRNYAIRSGPSHVNLGPRHPDHKELTGRMRADDHEYNHYNEESSLKPDVSAVLQRLNEVADYGNIELSMLYNIEVTKERFVL